MNFLLSRVLAFSLLLSRTCIQSKAFSVDFRRLSSIKRRKLRVESNSTLNGTPIPAARATRWLDCDGDLHEDVVKTSDPLADKVVVVEKSDDSDSEFVFTFDESGRTEVRELVASKESSGAEALELLSP